MSINERLVMVLVGGLIGGSSCFGLLIIGSDATTNRAFHAGVIAALLVMTLLALALWPRR